MALLTEMVTLMIILKLQGLTVMAILELQNCAGVPRVVNQTNILGVNTVCALINEFEGTCCWVLIGRL